MEKDDEVKGEGNQYTTEFRGYDPCLGKWLSLDPAMHTMPQYSPYSAFDNNPVFYNDPLGLKTTQELEEKAIQPVMNAMDNEIASVQRQIDSESDEEKLAVLQERHSQLVTGRTEIVGEIQALRDSEITYHYDSHAPEHGQQGEIFWRDGMVNLRAVLPVRGGDIADFAHELKHMYQFEVGLLSLAGDGSPSAGFLYDLADEWEAIQRMQLFGSWTEYENIEQIININRTYSSLPFLGTYTPNDLSAGHPLIGTVKNHSIYATLDYGKTWIVNPGIISVLRDRGEVFNENLVK